MDKVNLEKEILDFWEREKIFERTLQNRKGAKPFVFYEGPPTANGKPGIHHVLARGFKDLIPRFKTMQGYYVARKAGWDTHGLPVEIEVEKQLGISGKKDIENIVLGNKFESIKKFNALAKESVWKYKKEWEELTKRIGFWLNLEHPYITYENDYIEKLWGIIKQFHEKKLLYKGHKVVPHCPRCGTSLSSHELAQGYEDVTEPSVYVKFKILDGEYKNNYIVAWTTTPWTLPGNVALAVGKDIEYIKAGDLIIAKGTSGLDAGGTLVNLEKLIGSSYEPLYPFLKEKSKDVHTIVEADFVTTDEGTGVVHTAVMYGEDDYKLADRFDLPKIHTVGDDGKFNDFVKPFAGKFVKDADKDIIKDLENRGLLFKKENYTHSYPFCWRCGTALLYYAKDSWFVSMSTLREELIKSNKQIKWMPDHLQDGRFGEFLKEVKDWSFSRERYWGTPLPVWMCENGHVKVIGSFEELKSENKKLKIDDLHRPYIDEVTFKCQDCDKTMHREPYVCDVWFDSGSMPYASGEKDAGRFPADFIAEAIDQTRGWFYTLLAVSTALGDPSSFKAVISTGHVLDAKGYKMSKSKGNIIDPNEVIEKHGADSLRWYFYVMNQPGDNKSFVEKDLVTYKNKTLGILWNIYQYYQTYNRDKGHETRVKKHQILDQWITARLHLTIQLVTNHLEKYEITEAAREIMALIDDTSTWYLRRSRSRQDKEFFVTISDILLMISKLIAPFMPFNADALFNKLNKNSEISSVHLENWPVEDEKLIDHKLLKDMASTREIVSQALKLRSEAGIKVRQPLSKLQIPNDKLQKELLELIKDEVNIKLIVVGKKLELDTKITPELEKEGIAREIVRSIQDLRKQAGYAFNDKVDAFYETADKKISDAIKKYQKLIEQETLTILKQGIPGSFDKDLQTDTLKIAVKK